MTNWTATAETAEAEYYRRLRIVEEIEQELRSEKADGSRPYLCDQMIDGENTHDGGHEEDTPKYWIMMIASLEDRLCYAPTEEFGRERADELNVEKMYTDRVRAKS